VDTMSLSPGKHEPFHAVRSVMPLPPSFLLIQFDTDEYRLVDVAPYLDGDGPLIVPLRQWEFFKRVRVDEDGVTVVWPNGFDLDPAELYAVGTPIDLPRAILAR
jgi:hypothetical protein